MSRVIFGISTSFLGAAVLSLRQAMGNWSQERLARELGCSTGAIRKWEAGLRRPSELAVRRMVALAPDDETRALFGLKSEILNLELTPPPRARTYKEGDPELLRAYNMVLTGAEVIFDVAASGHDGARQALKDLGNQANRKAGHWRRMRDLKKKGS